MPKIENNTPYFDQPFVGQSFGADAPIGMRPWNYKMWGNIFDLRRDELDEMNINSASLTHGQSPFEEFPNVLYQGKEIRDKETQHGRVGDNYLFGVKGGGREISGFKTFLRQIYGFQAGT